MTLTQVGKITKIRKNGNEYIVGSGDVSGPSSSTNGHLAVFDGTTGKLIKDGGAVPSTSDCVKTSGTQTIAGTKTFSTSPVVPSKTSSATNSGTKIATEAQVYLKQDTLVSGTNIKTINNTSILGSGNISVGGISNNTTGTTSSVSQIWVGTETEYGNLSSTSDSILYFTF